MQERTKTEQEDRERTDGLTELIAIECPRAHCGSSENGGGRTGGLLCGSAR